jgi:ribosomal RNA-processing protein 17
VHEGENVSESEWEGFGDAPVPEFVSHEEEYIDEDRFTTVTVESVTIGRDGFHKPGLQDPGSEADKTEETKQSQKKKQPPKKAKKKFRYESRIEREVSGAKQKARRVARAQIQR